MKLSILLNIFLIILIMYMYGNDNSKPSKPHVNTADLQYLEKTFRILQKSYPETLENGWVIDIEKKQSDTVLVAYKKEALSATVTIVFKTNGEYEVNAIR